MCSFLFVVYPLKLKHSSLHTYAAIICGFIRISHYEYIQREGSQNINGNCTHENQQPDGEWWATARCDEIVVVARARPHHDARFRRGVHSAAVVRSCRFALGIQFLVKDQPPNRENRTQNATLALPLVQRRRRVRTADTSPK